MRSELQCGRLKNQAAMFSSDSGGRTFKWKYPRAEEVHRPTPPPEMSLWEKKTAPEEAMLTQKHGNQLCLGGWQKYYLSTKESGPLETCVKRDRFRCRDASG